MMQHHTEVQAAYARLLRKDFSSFIAKSFRTVDPGARYLPNWHIALIAEYLEAVRRGEIKRLIINMPPRALKSVSVSVAWPAWLLGHDASARIICASYAAPLALKHSIDCRMLMRSPWYRALFPHVALTRDQNEKHKFMTTKRGYRFATSVGGVLTGEGGNTLIIDDPLTPAQAASAQARAQVNHWFSHTFASRLDDKEKGAIVLVMQRLHLDDLSGYLLARGGWTHLCLPAVAPKTEIYERGDVCVMYEEGDCLHPERENEAAVARAKSELGTQAFAAQYQKNPLPEEGGMVRAHWLRRYDVAPTPARIVQSWDTAIKSGAQHDASCCLTFAEHAGEAYLLEACVVRMEYPELKKLIVTKAEQYQPQAVLMEDKSSGQQLLQDLKRDSWLPLIAVQPRGDKITRFAGVSALIEAGRLHLPRHAPWLGEFETELLHFPAARHDDQVDALTQYLDWVRGRAGSPGMRRV